MASVTDLSTHQSRFMVASGKQRVHEHERSTTCSGTPFNFHPEYNTAQQQNQVPWAALEGGVLMQQEIGHFEPCSSVTNAFPVDASFPAAARHSATTRCCRPASAASRAASRPAKALVTRTGTLSDRDRPKGDHGLPDEQLEHRGPLRVFRLPRASPGPRPMTRSMACRSGSMADRRLPGHLFPER